jgi:uncharacterized protein YdhG (YjbR/CyaY superfamily)
VKKVKSRKSSSAGNRKCVPKNVDEYLARLPEPARSTLNKIRAVIRSAVPPEATETISYRIPSFDCVSASLRQVLTSLRMTQGDTGWRSFHPNLAEYAFDTPKGAD